MSYTFSIGVNTLDSYKKLMQYIQDTLPITLFNKVEQIALSEAADGSVRIVVSSPLTAEEEAVLNASMNAYDEVSYTSPVKFVYESQVFSKCTVKENDWVLVFSWVYNGKQIDPTFKGVSINASSSSTGGSSYWIRVVDLTHFTVLSTQEYTNPQDAPQVLLLGSESLPEEKATLELQVKAPAYVTSLQFIYVV